MNGLFENQASMDWSLTGNSKEAFEAFVKTHMKKAYFTALGLVGNHDDALELSQEAFARAYQCMGTLNTPGKLFPWFYQILRNLCFSHLRKRRHRQTEPLYDRDGRLVDVPGEDRFDPEVVTEANETKNRLWKAIGLLEEKHREVIILRHFQHMSYEQMAKVLFCSKGTVTSRLYYARKRLKEILELEKGGPL